MSGIRYCDSITSFGGLDGDFEHGMEGSLELGWLAWMDVHIGRASDVPFSSHGHT
jgi:hypothetical protein